MTTAPASNRDSALSALAHPIRREIVESLQDGPHAVHTLCDHFDVSQQAISKHLARLDQAGLVRRERKGRETVCHLRTEPLEDLQAWLESFWTGRLDALKALAEERDEREIDDQST